MNDKPLVSMTPEESAAWLRGEESWLDHISDPKLKVKIRRQQKAIQEAFYQSAMLFAEACDRDSKQTAARLRQLHAESFAGDLRATQLLITMMGELLSTAFTIQGDTNPNL